MTERTYDVVIWGATGFTGKLAADYMFATYGLNGDVKWAVAGRSASKLSELRQAVAGADGDQIPELVADSHDEAHRSDQIEETREIGRHVVACLPASAIIFCGTSAAYAARQ